MMRNIQGENFDFSEDDVKRLRQIAILRKYGFSLKEIKALIDSDITAKDFLDKHIVDLKNDVNSNINVINSMLNVSRENFENMDDLCAQLNNPQIAGRPIPVDDSKNPYKLLYQKEKKCRKLFQVLFSFLVLLAAIFSFVRSNSFLITNKSGIISSDYESLQYLDKKYLKFDSGEYDAELGNILVENAAVEGDSFSSKFMINDDIYSVSNAPNTEIVFLETDYDYDYPNSKSEYYYVEESVYDKYSQMIDEYKPETYKFKICNDNYDDIYIDISEDMIKSILSIDKATAQSVDISGYYQKGYNDGIPICAFDSTRTFYKLIGEVQKYDDEYYYFDYNDADFKSDGVTKISSKVYKIDNKFSDKIQEILSKQNGITIKFGIDE
ncbi:MAG: MerR family transcriptional regulator [Eubacterium sp.]